MQQFPPQREAIQLMPWVSSGPGYTSGLSFRELQILTLLGKGFTSDEIAQTLYISTCTVSSHRRNIIAKTGVRNTAHLVYTACQEGWI